ncbi:MAG: type II toxin-antitoxin system RelB/DinJ family antitoxin [Oscillospiraceae bacterium]|nr:type II toxin-antitoxin system RelB/DinJ family antitoxin [Oscillospiraceae bacterium]
MNTKSNINVRIDTNVKILANQILDRMGIDQTTAIDMFFRQIIAERRLPFQPTPVQTYGEKTLDIIKRKNIPNIRLEADENGNAYIDKERYPELYDWAVHG